MGMKLNGLTEGMDLPSVENFITQENINRYADVSRDFNPIHTDEEFARKTPLGGTIAHGMLILAYVSQMMTAVFGQSWLTGGKLGVRFKAPARPGDTVKVTGKITKIDKSDKQTTVTCTVLCSNQKGEAVITGETQVKIKQ
jgi:3-hydroxybutyryl-CoA dehydratase